MTDTPEPREDRAAQTASVDEASAMLGEVIQRMGFEAVIHVREQQGEHWLEIESPEASRLIGREGQTLDALQLLLRRMTVRGVPGAPRITLDVGDYRRRHLKQLRLTAKDAADVVLHTGRPVTLEPMPAPERRIIHHVLREVEGVETVSMRPQRGGLKSIEIRPVGGEEEDAPAPESESAPESPPESAPESTVEHE